MIFFFSIFDVWTPELAILGLKIEFYASKSIPGSPPEVRKREINPEHEKLFLSVVLIRSWGYKGTDTD